MNHIQHNENVWLVSADTQEKVHQTTPYMPVLLSLCKYSVDGPGGWFRSLSPPQGVFVPLTWSD